MARSKSKNTAGIEAEPEMPSAELRQEKESFVGAEPAFAELRRSPESAETIAEMKREAMHRRALDFLEEFRKATVNIVFAGIVGLLVLTFVKVTKADELSIDPVSLPKAIKDLGYTEEGVALTLSDNMFKIFNEVSLAKHSFKVKAKIDEADFAVPVAGLSFSAAIRLTRQIIGFPQRHIAGEIICPSEPCNSSNIELHLRVMDGIHPPKVLEPIKAASPDALLKSGAEKILAFADPVSLAAYLFGEDGKNTDRRPEAVELAKQVLRDNGKDRSIALNILGAATANQPNASDEMHQTALGYYQAAIKEDPTYASAYGNLGSELAKMRNYENAAEYLKKSVALDPNSPLFQYNLGIVYLELGQFQNALEPIKAAAALSPNDPATQNAWGVCLQQLHDADGAIEKYNEAIRLDPKSSSAYSNVARVYIDKGMKAEAKAKLEQGLPFAADDADKKNFEDMLKSVE